MFGAVVARALLGEGVEIHLIERCPDVLSSWNDARGHHLHRRVLVGHQTTAHAKHRHRAFVSCVLMWRVRAVEAIEWKGFHGNAALRAPATATAGRFRHGSERVGHFRTPLH